MGRAAHDSGASKHETSYESRRACLAAVRLASDPPTLTRKVPTCRATGTRTRVIPSISYVGFTRGAGGQISTGQRTGPRPRRRTSRLPPKPADCVTPSRREPVGCVNSVVADFQGNPNLSPLPWATKGVANGDGAQLERQRPDDGEGWLERTLSGPRSWRTYGKLAAAANRPGLREGRSGGRHCDGDNRMISPPGLQQDSPANRLRPSLRTPRPSEQNALLPRRLLHRYQPVFPGTTESAHPTPPPVLMPG
jgi:hypothetical protein